MSNFCDVCDASWWFVTLLQLCKAVLCHYREKSINNQKWSVSNNMGALFRDITMILRVGNMLLSLETSLEIQKMICIKVICNKI